MGSIFLLDFFPLNLWPSLTDPHQNSLPLPVLFDWTIMCILLFLSFLGWDSNSLLHHQREASSLCSKDQGALPGLVSSLCLSPLAFETRPSPCPKPLPKLCRMFGHAIWENLLNQSSTGHRPPWLSPVMSFLPFPSPSCHHICVLIPPVDRQSWHIKLMWGEHTATHDVSLWLWFVNSKNGSCLGPWSNNEGKRAQAQWCIHSLKKTTAKKKKAAFLLWSFVRRQQQEGKSRYCSKCYCESSLQWVEVTGKYILFPTPKSLFPSQNSSHGSETELAFHWRISSWNLAELGGHLLAPFFRGNEHHQPVSKLGLNITLETQNLASEEWEGQKASGTETGWESSPADYLSWKYQVRGRKSSTANRLK